MGTRCACLRSRWEDAKGKHEANQLRETFPVLVLSDEKETKCPLLTRLDTFPNNPRW